MSRQSRASELTGRNRKSIEEKGTNIQVVLRCRGLNEHERALNSPVEVEVVESRKRNVRLKSSKKVYSFDHVFDDQSTQEHVYNEVAQPILDEVLRGYNCTILAYGQTGTGKTYTMEGDLSDHAGKHGPEAGIIPRTIYKLFETLDAQGAEYSVRVSLIELYNEEIRDLLNPSDETKSLRIFDPSGGAGVRVRGMEESLITNASQGLHILQKGSMYRSIGTTKCNDKSSRSHSVFTLTVRIKETLPGGDEVLKVGKLNLVDLAGSENISRSGAENGRAREAGMINQSLLTLGRVINLLVEHAGHVPYRDSKLTLLLKDSLGGRTKTCIIATVSMAKVNHDEIVSTLDYASRAKNIQNRPQANEQMSPRLLLHEYETTIERLKADLQATRDGKGVRLSQQSYDLMITENETRRLDIDRLSKQVEEFRESLKAKSDDLKAKTELLMGKESELKHILISLGNIDQKLKVKINEFSRKHSQESTNIETSVALLESLQNNTSMMEALLKQSVDMQREFADKMSQIRMKLEEEVELKSSLAAKDINTFFDGFDNDLNGIIGLVKKIDLDFIKNHLGSEHSYILSKKTVTEQMQTRMRSFHQDTIDKTSLFQKQILKQMQDFQDSLSNDFQGLDKTIESDAQNSLNQDVKRLQQLQGAKEQLLQTQDIVKEINDNVAIMRAGGESGHQRVRQELPSLVSLVESAGAKIETEKRRLGHFDCQTDIPANTERESMSQRLEAAPTAQQTRNSVGPPPEPTPENKKDTPEDKTGDGPKEPSRVRVPILSGKRKPDSSIYGPSKRIAR
ncbi:P-loop containing nucleoside triphosphate hydrolase protein [Phycomyces blakesleeanus]